MTKFVKVFHILIDNEVNIDYAEKIMAEIQENYSDILKVEYHAVRELNNQ